MQNFTRVGLPIAILGAALLAYLGGYIPEAIVGSLLAALAVLTPAPYVAKAVSDSSTSVRAPVAFYIIAGLSTILAAIPIYFALYPGEAQFAGQLNDDNKSAHLGDVPAGAYVVTVEGALDEKEGEVTADYRLKAVTGDNVEIIDGSLWRRFDRVRVGRRGSAQQEHARTFENHPVRFPGGETDLVLVKSAPELTQGLRVALHKVLLPALWFWILASVLFLSGAYVEARFASDKNRSLFTSAQGFIFFLAYMIPNQISPQTVVKPVIGSAIAAGLVGITAAGIVSFFARKFFRPEQAETARLATRGAFRA